jgi:transposase
MIDYATYCEIRALHRNENLSAAQIARKLQLDKKTVRYWLRHAYHQQKRPERSSKLDPHKARIKAWLEQHDFTAQQILQKLQAEGIQVGYTIVREYVRTVRPKPIQAFLTLHFCPGECMQVDWGSWGFIPVGTTRRRLSFFVAVLCYSRMMYVEFTLGQSQEHFLQCHQNAFAFFGGGVPERVMVDNCKTAVLSHPVGLPPQFNPRYLDFASHYGFEVRACAPRKGNEKGRVENGVKFIKENFLRGLELPPWAALNPAARHWLETIANTRLHRETHKTPLELFKEEKSKLKPVSVLPYDTALVRSLPVNSRFRVVLDTNRYSVPAHWAGTALTAKIYADRLALYHQDQPVAEHVRSYDRHRDFEHPDHAQPLLAQRQKAREQQSLSRFLSLCPQAPEYYAQLQQRRLNARHHVQKIMALAEIYGPEKIVRAIEDAHHYQAYSCEYIANLLEQRERKLPEPGALHLTRAADLLELDLPEPDLSLYEPKTPPASHPESNSPSGPEPLP